jgi:hypothetical protein
MTSKIRKDIATGAIAFTGAVLVIVAAEISAPILAGFGAFASLSAGIYQAVTSPRRMRQVPAGRSDADDRDDRVSARGLVGKC